MRPQSEFGPTRLAAAWVLLIGSVFGIVFAAIIMPPAPVRTGDVAIAIPARADAYGASDTAEIVPELHQTAMVANAEIEPVLAVSEAQSSAPLLVLTPAPQAAIPALPLEDDPNGEIIITLPRAGRLSGDHTKPAGPALPNPSLMASTPSGKRPTISAKGITPFETYRRYDRRLLNAPNKSIAIMVSGLGLDQALTARAIANLPPEITLSFVPYARDLEGQIAAAVAAGHEVALEIPMEQAGVTAQTLGSAALTTAHSPEANAQRLEWILSRASAYPMVTNYLGGTFSSDGAAMLPMMQTLGAAGLAYLDDTGLAHSSAAQAQVSHGRIAGVIAPGSPDVAAQLAQIAARANSTPALVKVYAASGGLDGVMTWVQSDGRSAVSLVPASSIVKDPL